MNPVVSFRDPAGSVSVTDERVIRTVFAEGLANLTACLGSPTARQFVERGALVATRVCDEASSLSHRDVQVEHPRIPFLNYPCEWPAVMLHAAAKLTLDLCRSLLEEGLGLKDATPCNILFAGTRPVFVDVLSVEKRDAVDPIWRADAQFARTFLIPLLLHRRTGYPVHELFLFHRDGISPVEAVRRLPGLRRWFPPDLGLVTAPAYASRFENAALYGEHYARDSGEARYILSRRFCALGKKLDCLAPLAANSAWSTYEAECPSYSAEQHAAKHTFVERTLEAIRPSRVLDVGSNTGTYSMMAAAGGASVVAIDRDPQTVAALWRLADSSRANILPLVVDFARPTPPAGWRGQEQAGFLERTAGFFDCALFLGVIHHLMVTDQIPLAQIFEVATSVTSRWLVIEYVGPGDQMFRRLARGRDSLYQSYNRNVFEECAKPLFNIVNSLEIPSSDRSIYLLRRKS